MTTETQEVQFLPEDIVHAVQMASSALWNIGQKGQPSPEYCRKLSTDLGTVLSFIANTRSAQPQRSVSESRMRAALTFYADENSYARSWWKDAGQWYRPIEEDLGYKARAALSEHPAEDTDDQR